MNFILNFLSFDKGSMPDLFHNVNTLFTKNCINGK